MKTMMMKKLTLTVLCIVSLAACTPSKFATSGSSTAVAAGTPDTTSATGDGTTSDGGTGSGNTTPTTDPTTTTPTGGGTGSGTTTPTTDPTTTTPAAGGSNNGGNTGGGTGSGTPTPTTDPTKTAPDDGNKGGPHHGGGSNNGGNTGGGTNNGGGSNNGGNTGGGTNNGGNTGGGTNNGGNTGGGNHGGGWNTNPPAKDPRHHHPGTAPSCSPSPSASPVATPVPTPAPTPVATPPVCTPVDLSKLSTLMIQRFTRTVTDVAYNCIDATTPNLQDNMPTGDGSFPEVRFMNTCGNRYCQSQLGFESGRVIEIGPNGAATVECIHSTPPVTGNSCEGVVAASPLVNHVQTTITQTASECRDADVPNLQDNMPAASTARFVDTCGKRSCQLRGYRDGRVIEFAYDLAILECYQDPGHFWVDQRAQMVDIARNCIDSANPRLEDNGPEVNQVRYMTTCGDRYCRNVLGQRSGKVVEYKNGMAILTCVAQ